MNDEESKHTDHMVDPDLYRALDVVRGIVVDEATLPSLRDNAGQRIPELTDAEAVGTEMSRHDLPARSGDPHVGVAVFRPTSAMAHRGALLHLHGGGYI